MKIHSVKYNFIMNAILTVAGIIFPLITFPYISRVLLVEGSGKVALRHLWSHILQCLPPWESRHMGSGMCDCKRQQRKTLQDRSGTVDHQWRNNTSDVHCVRNFPVCHTGVCTGANIASDRWTWDRTEHHRSAVAV